MIIAKIIKTGKYILGGLLLSGMITSCTKDYFVDENNYWIYVPEIKQRTIQDFYVAFHDKDGNHLRTRRFSEADFNEPYITDGVIRSKLKFGEVNVMCFAQLNTIAVTEGQPLSQSYLSLPPIDENKHIYTTARLDCRVFHKIKTVYPIGHPLARVDDTISMNEDCVYTGYIGVNFKNLPDIVDRVEVLYSGLATRMNFDGTMGTFASSDRVWVSYPAAGADHSLIQFKDSFLPSAGTLISAKTDGTAPQEGRTPLKLEVIFYQGDQQVGYLTEKDLGGEFPVTDGKGNPVTGDVFLEPRGTIEFNFEGFTLVNIQLLGWGEINPGDVTPV